MLSVLGSMATRTLLADLAAAWDGAARAESVGGVDAARRLRAGEAVDVALLAEGAMRGLERDGVLRPGSLHPVTSAAFALAVRAGTPLPDLASEAALCDAVSATPRIGYSTGPSGDHLLALLGRWGLLESLAARLVQAPPGVPVGRLLAEGTVDLAFQQLPELANLPGITVADRLPGAVAARTVFAAGVPARARDAAEARRFVCFLRSPGAAEAMRRHGLDPA